MASESGWGPYCGPKGVAWMIRVVINVSGGLYASGIELALKKSGEFRTAVLRSGDTEQILLTCREQKADVLLLGVTPAPGFGVRERTELIARVRRALPRCRIVLIVDDSVSESVNEDVKSLKQTGVIDAFLFTSATNFSYLEAILQSI